MSTVIDFTGGKPTNNNYRSSGSDGQLTTSRACQQWQRMVPNLQPGDLVLLREDNTTPLQWPTAVITDVHAGRDGIVWVVTLRTPSGTFKRPITKICPSPLVNGE